MLVLNDVLRPRLKPVSKMVYHEPIAQKLTNLIGAIEMGCFPTSASEGGAIAAWSLTQPYNFCHLLILKIIQCLDSERLID